MCTDTCVATFEPDGTAVGGLRSFNEYYTTAYLAHLFPKPQDRATVDRAFGRMWGPPVAAAPTGLGSCPFRASFNGHSLLTGGCVAPPGGGKPSHFVSSFAVLFDSFLCGGFRNSSFYAQLLSDWRLADQSFFSTTLNASSTVWGTPGAKGNVWGCGAGPAPVGYVADSISHNPDLVVSPHIMAGFLDRSDDTTRAAINAQIGWMGATGACLYNKTLADGTAVSVPWRCSVAVPEWRADHVDIIDFSTFVLGYATNFIDYDFFGRYAA